MLTEQDIMEIEKLTKTINWIPSIDVQIIIADWKTMKAKMERRKDAMEYMFQNREKWRESHMQLEQDNDTLREALVAYVYYKPLQPPIGGGQAEGTLACGHGGRIGAPCCEKCARAKIKSALEKKT